MWEPTPDRLWISSGTNSAPPGALALRKVMTAIQNRNELQHEVTMAMARTTKIDRAATSPRHDLEHHCRDLNGWPRSWMGLEKDLPPGEQLLTLFRPLLEYPATSNLSPKTIRKHVDNMWALGGEFIRDLHSDPSLRKKPVERVLLQMIEFGAPLLYHGGEDQRRSFDSTCRKFRRFLTETAR